MVHGWDTSSATERSDWLPGTVHLVVVDPRCNKTQLTQPEKATAAAGAFRVVQVQHLLLPSEVKWTQSDFPSRPALLVYIAYAMAFILTFNRCHPYEQST